MKLDTWQVENNIKFNNNKFKLLQFGKNKELKESYTYLSPDLSDVIIPEDTVRDLGVTFNKDGNFSNHISNIAKKARQRIGMLLRSFMNRDITFLKFCWRNYIQPILDYSSQLWGPSEDGDNLIKLEYLLKSFTSRARGLKNIHYWERLKLFGLSSVNRRIE